MGFDVTATGTLKGRISLPGDERLTLLVMAFALTRSGTVVIENPSPSPSVAAMRDTLSALGVEVVEGVNLLTVHGRSMPKRVEVGESFPDEVLGILIGAVVGSGGVACMYAQTPERRRIVEFCAGIFDEITGVDFEIHDSGTDIVISGGTVDAERQVTVRAAEAMEVVAALCMAAGVSVTVTCSLPAVSHVFRLLQMFGADIGCGESLGRETELERRMARLTGRQSLDTRRVVWGDDDRAVTVAIPGDTILASAIAASAVQAPRSDVIIEGVLWEQSRRGFFDVLKRMKVPVDADVKRSRMGFDSAVVNVKWGLIEGIHLTSEQALSCRSELLILGALAATAQGETVITDPVNAPGRGRDAFGRLSVNLEMMGAHVGDFTDGFAVRGGPELAGDLVDAAGIPDLALALVVAGMSAGGVTALFGYNRDSYPLEPFFTYAAKLGYRQGGTDF